MSAPTATDLAVNEATTQVNAVAAEPGFKVFAGNLTYQTDEAALKDFFKECSADILSVQIIFHGHRSAGYGFVTFSNEDAANKSVSALDKKELNGRTVIVERAKPLEAKRDRAERRNKRNFAGRRGSKAVPGEATEPKAESETPADHAAADLAADLAAQGDAAKPKKKKKSNKRKAKKPADAEGAAAEAGADGTAPAATTDTPADANATHVERTRKPRKPRAPRRPRGEAPTGEPSTTVLFVANLAFSVDEAQLTEFFTDAGVTVKSARVVRWRWGTPRKSKGYAFVDVGGPEEQKKAIEAVAGKTIANRDVTVKVAVNTPHKADDSKEGGDSEAAPAADHVEPVVAVA